MLKAHLQIRPFEAGIMASRTLDPKRVISVNENTKLVNHLFSCCGETSNSRSSSWIAYWLFVGTLVLLYKFARKVVDRRSTTGLPN